MASLPGQLEAHLSTFNATAISLSWQASQVPEPPRVAAPIRL
jgi:hypothetical protein